jgi:hypothetical protein
VDEGEVLEVAETFVFPEYDSESQWGDIAVLRLAHAAPADLTWPIEIMPVPVKSGTTVMALGWGKQEEKDVGKHGRKVRAAVRARVLMWGGIAFLSRKSVQPIAAC